MRTHVTLMFDDEVEAARFAEAAKSGRVLASDAATNQWRVRGIVGVFTWTMAEAVEAVTKERT